MADENKDKLETPLEQYRIFQNSRYKDEFFSQLFELYEQKKYTDIKLVCSVGNEPISCHKLILSCLSPYFKTMFLSDFNESKSNEIIMPETDPCTMLSIVHYAYTGELKLDVANVQSVFCLASLLQVESIVNICAEFMDANMDLTNCLDLLKFSTQFNSEFLHSKSREFVLRNFSKLIKGQEFLEFGDGDLLADVMADDKLDIPNEELLVTGLLDWVNKDPNERSAFFKNIFLNCVRLGLLDREFYENFLAKNKDFLFSCFGCKENLHNSINPRLAVKFKQRSGMAKAEHCFLLIGGNCDLADGTYVNCFNPFNGEKYFLSKSYTEKAAFIERGYFHTENPGVCVTSENRIFVAGGVLVFHQYKTSKIQPRSSTSTSTVYEEFKSIFTDPESLRDGDETLSKELFEYDIFHNTWQKRSNMLFAKANFSLCALNNEKLYSFGGISIGQIPLDVVECYDVNENKWSYVGTMPSAFVAGSVVEHNKKFYILGGRSGVGRHDSCYVFDPDKHEWTEIASMGVGRFNFGACVYNEKIYVFGGQRYAESREHYFTREALDSVEIYDLATNSWTQGLQMPASLYNTGVSVYNDKSDSIFVCGTTECQFSGTTLFGFMFTSVFRLDFITDINNELKFKWTIVEHDVSDIKAYYRCVAASVNTRKLYKFNTQIELRK